MKSIAKNIKLSTVDDLFSTEESRKSDNLERVMEIPLSARILLRIIHLKSGMMKQ